jgi:hypothetical protein
VLFSYAACFIHYSDFGCRVLLLKAQQTPLLHHRLVRIGPQWVHWRPRNLGWVVQTVTLLDPLVKLQGRLVA